MSLNLVFKALSDGTRRRILRMLQEKDMSAGDIARHFDMSKPSISHHLNVLKQADLVQDVRQGQNIFYSLNSTVFQEIMAWFFELTDHGEKSGNNPRVKREDHGDTQDVKAESTGRQGGDIK